MPLKCSMLTEIVAFSSSSSVGWSKRVGAACETCTTLGHDRRCIRYRRASRGHLQHLAGNLLQSPALAGSRLQAPSTHEPKPPAHWSAGPSRPCATLWPQARVRSPAAATTDQRHDTRTRRLAKALTALEGDESLGQGGGQ